MSSATTVATLVVDELVRCGLRDVVLAPGSRSAPLAYAFAAAADAGRLRLHVRIDERSAAFLALGLAKGSGRPVAVGCTSGTATANFHPAVLEAGESAVALVVLTADRPPELRGVGANQTVDQAGLYAAAVRAQTELGDVPDGAVGPYVRSTVDRLVDAALGTLTGDAGPVHLNLPFREPLVPDGDAPPAPAGRPDGRRWTEVTAAAASAAPLDVAPTRTLVVVGDTTPELGSRARRWAEACGWPLVAEPSSGARGGPQAVPAGSLLLGLDGVVDALRPERVLVVGRPTLTRSVSALLRRDDALLEVRSTGPRWPDAGRRAYRVAVGLPVPPVLPVPPDGAGAPPGDPDWNRAWLRAGRAAADARDEVLAESVGLTGPLVARAVAAAATGGQLVVGSSNPVRDLDTAVDDLDGCLVQANRGAAGIDGMVSTAFGLALTHPVPTWAVLGDLTFLHDSNGLVLGGDEARPPLCLVVVDNDGGGIFETLEQGTGDRRSFERLFGTSHGTDLAALCAASGTPYVRADDAAHLPGLLTAGSAEPGIRVVHVRIDRAGLVETRKQIARAARAAVGRVLGRFDP